MAVGAHHLAKSPVGCLLTSHPHGNFVTELVENMTMLARIAWGTVPDWISAAAFWALAIEVYVRWKQDPERPPILGDQDDS